MVWKTRLNKAFTLVEIMIVIAIIGIIVGIAMPAFLRSREISRARACQENLAKIDGAVTVYAIHNKKHTGDSVAFTDLILQDSTGYLKAVPKCPSAGTYAVTQIDADPTCSIGANTGASFAPHLINVPVPATD